MSKLIEIGKKYTSNGRPVTIRYVDGKDARFPVLAEFEDGGVGCFSPEGHYSNPLASAYDLVEVSPYADWKIDQKIIVSDDGVMRLKRYFAGVRKDGVCLAWDGGATSWSISPGKEPLPWKHARLPTPEELGD